MKNKHYTIDNFIKSFMQRIEENHEYFENSRVDIMLWLEKTFEKTLIETFPDANKHRMWHEPLFRESSYHLTSIENKIDQLLFLERQPCRLSETDATRFPQLITALNDSKASSTGSSKFIGSLSKWFEGKNRAAIIDPYIFSSGNEDQKKYCQGLVELIGKSPERIDFYFRHTAKSYNKNIADDVVNELNKDKKRDFNFFACANIHDRVWMAHYSTEDTPPKAGWEGRVVGSSVNGIKIRPTYIIEMPKKDVEEYSTYLMHLQNEGGIEKARAPHFTAPPPQPI